MSFAQGAPVWRTQVQIALWRHGWAWPMAAIATMLALAVQFFVVEPSAAALALARADLRRESLAASHDSAPIAVTDERQRLQALQAVLRQSPQADELVRKLASLAQAQRIALTQSDYQQQFHGTTQVVQMRVTQPVRASYSQLRNYIESVLRSMPNVSLDQISARRDNVGQSQLDARLRWSFWIQAASTVSLNKSVPGDNTP